MFVDHLRETWDPRAIRLAILDQHYRTSWEWDDSMMPRAAARLARWLAGAGDATTDTATDSKGLVEVRDALDHDLDTRAALTAIDDAAARGESVRTAAALLGVDLTVATGT